MSLSAASNNVSVSTRDEKVMFSVNHGIELDTFMDMNFIPTRNRAKYLRCFYIISSIVVIITVLSIIGITIVWTLNDGKYESKFRRKPSGTKTSKIIYDYSGSLVMVINQTKCMKFQPKTKKLDLLFEAPNKSAITSFDIHDDHCIYWTEAKSSRLNYQCNDEFKVLLEEKRFVPEGSALDRVTENIYMVDETAGTLIVLNRQSGNYAILLTDLINARDVVLDSEEGLVFILQHSHSILRANMDGSKWKEIVKSNKITSLTIDPKRKRLYWVNNIDNIKSSDYDGNTQQLIFNDTVRITGVTVLDDDIFWTRPSHEKSTSVLSCKINSDGMCKDHKTHEINSTGNVNSIRGYSTFTSTISNPCEENHCTQLCLLIDKNKSGCACRMGWQLDPDNRSCHEVRDFVLYPYGDFVRTCSLDGKQEIYWPTRYSVDSQRGNREIEFDYEFKRDYFYFTDRVHIYRMKLKDYSVQEIFLSANASNIKIEKIAYDWLTGNMYYVQRSEPKPFTYTFAVYKAPAYRKTLYTHTFTFERIYASGLIVHPLKRYLFATLTDNADEFSWFYHGWINGTKLECIGSRDYTPVTDNGLRLFNIDLSDNQLYIALDKQMTTELWITNIHNVTLKGAGFESVANLKSLGFNQKWIYLSNLTSIYRVDKESRNDLKKIVPRVELEGKSIAGVKIISEETQFTDADNPCDDDNGGCEQFCFIGSKATCDCQDGQQERVNGLCQ